MAPDYWYVSDGTDCNDYNTAVHPGAVELCDGSDNNCNGETDEGCTPSSCGNGIIDPGEQCDDSNQSVGDGCDQACQTEAGWGCVFEPSYCFEIICGDGYCDPGEPDTCSGDCQFVNCGNGTCDPGEWIGNCLADCTPVCGNGLIDNGEQCDDNNLNAGDGCSDVCQTEYGFSCTGQPSVCTQLEICRDGVDNDGNGQIDEGCVCGDGICAFNEQELCPEDCIPPPMPAPEKRPAKKRQIRAKTILTTICNRA
jgi:cysteine-rich repeat protein